MELVFEIHCFEKSQGGTMIPIYNELTWSLSLMSVSGTVIYGISSSGWHILIEHLTAYRLHRYTGIINSCWRSLILVDFS